MPILNSRAESSEQLSPGNQTTAQYRQADFGHQQRIRHSNISRDMPLYFHKKSLRNFIKHEQQR
jgi:hypothetical protein